MKRSLVALLGVALGVALAAPAIGIGGDDGRKVVDTKTLAPVTEPYTGAANAIRLVPGGGLPWEIDRGKADLRADGHLRIEVEGLVLARRAPVPVAVQGTNPVTQFKAVVSCLTTSAGVATATNVSSPLVPASAAGDAEIETTIALPSPCFAPIVFVTSPGGSWFAVTGR